MFNQAIIAEFYDNVDSDIDAISVKYGKIEEIVYVRNCKNIDQTLMFAIQAFNNVHLGGKHLSFARIDEWSLVAIPTGDFS